LAGCKLVTSGKLRIVSPLKLPQLCAKIFSSIILASLRD
jgi:hypothetical protein